MTLIECYVRIVFPEANRVCEEPFSFGDYYLTSGMIKNPKKSDRSWIDEPDIQHPSVFLVEHYQRVRVGSFSSKVIVRIDEEFIPPDLRDNPTSLLNTLALTAISPYARSNESTAHL